MSLETNAFEEISKLSIENLESLSNLEDGVKFNWSLFYPEKSLSVFMWSLAHISCNLIHQPW